MYTLSEIAMIFINLGLILALGLFFGRIAEKCKIPAISGYLVAGLILGPVTGIISLAEVDSFSVISNLALAFIAFQVGNELWLGKLKKTGGKIITITIMQALITTIIVTSVTAIFVDFSIALILGAIAAATAPAPIMMIIKKYRAKGDVANTVVPLTGLDDAIGVLLFSILLSISLTRINPNNDDIHILQLIGDPLMEIGISVIIGSVIGFISGFLMKRITKNNEQQEKDLNLVLITILLTAGIAMYFNASPILTPMIAGAFVTNMINKETYTIEDHTIRSFIPPLMILFFTVAGAQLQFGVVFSAGIVGIMYIVSRIIGKIGGSYIGTSIVKSSSNIKKYLGITLLPQSGVAIGLSVAAYNEFVVYDVDSASIIRNVILASVLFFALTGPVLVKISLEKANEINTNEEDMSDERIPSVQKNCKKISRW